VRWLRHIARGVAGAIRAPGAAGGADAQPWHTESWVG
jgi:hypothetical protein